MVMGKIMEKGENWILNNFINRFPFMPGFMPGFIKWYFNKLMPFIINIAKFFLLLWIFGKVNEAYGIERMIALGMIIIILSLRSLVSEFKS